MTASNDRPHRRPLDEEGRQLLRKIVEAQAWRQLAAVNILGHCLKFVTRVESKELVVQELNMSLRVFSEVRTLYDELGWNELTAEVRAKTDRVPLPASRLEFGVCRYLCDQAERVAMGAYLDSCEPRFAAIARTVVENKSRLVPEGDEVFTLYCQEPVNRPHAQEMFDRWLGVALLAFGRPHSAGDRRAVELGLRSHHAHEMARDYVASLASFRTRCSIEQPAPAQLGVEFAL